MLSLDLYLGEIRTFLKSLVIKNNYLAEQMLDTCVNSEYREFMDVSSEILDGDNITVRQHNPYYQFLWGNYIKKSDLIYLYDVNDSSKTAAGYRANQVYTDLVFLDEMVVAPVETNEDGTLVATSIPLTKDTFFSLDSNGYRVKRDTYAKTLSALRSRGSLYKNLCTTYPDNIFLINAIIWPLGEKYSETNDIETIIKLPNFTLLNCDLNTLNSNEQQSMLSKVIRVLTVLQKRWDVKEFTYEKYYANAQWILMWNYLNLALVEQRYFNIRTNAVHRFHIKEYMYSKGLGEFYPYFDDTQNSWIYRNFDYIYANRGKDSSCLLMAEHLLPSTAELRARSMVLNTTNSQNYEYIPEFISEQFGLTDAPYAAFVEGSENHYQIFDRVYKSNLEPIETDLAVSKQYDKLSRSKYTYLPTKLVEIKNNAFNTRYSDLYYRVIFDNLMGMLADNQIQFSIDLKDKSGSYGKQVTPNQIIYLLEYINLRDQYSHDKIMNYIYAPNAIRSEYKLRNTLPIVIFNATTNRITATVNHPRLAAAYLNGLTNTSIFNEISIIEWLSEHQSYLKTGSTIDRKMIPTVLSVGGNSYKIYYRDLPENITISAFNKNSEIFDNVVNRQINYRKYWQNFFEIDRKTTTSDLLVTECIINPYFAGKNYDDVLYFLEAKWENVLTLVKADDEYANALDTYMFEQFLGYIRTRNNIVFNSNPPALFKDVVADGSYTIQRILSTLKELDNDLLDEIFSETLNQLINIQASKYNTVPDMTDIFYKKVREFFKRMSSYNLAFIEADYNDQFSTIMDHTKILTLTANHTYEYQQLNNQTINGDLEITIELTTSGS